MKIKYIDNKPLYGIKRDFEYLKREFKKMLQECGAPQGLYGADLPDDEAKWFILMSERSSSKTTQILLKYGLLNNKLYGLKFAYIRREKSQTTESMHTKLFEVINNPIFGYVNYLTNGLYNCVVVERNTKNIYYAKRGEDGKIIDKSEIEIGVIMSVEEYTRYCSNYNVTDYDTIILDEFSWGKQPTSEEFFHFCQIIATLRRERRSVKMYLLSNTISPYNHYLKELCVSSHVIKMQKGQHALITTELGASVYVEMLDVEMHKTVEFKVSSLEYFGFNGENGERLRSLYGGEWEIKGFRHLPHSENRSLTWTSLFLDYMGNMLRIATFQDGAMQGVFISAYTSKLKNDAMVFPINPRYNAESLRCRNRNIIRRLMMIDDMGLLYFSDNETAMQFYAYIDEL